MGSWFGSSNKDSEKDSENGPIRAGLGEESSFYYDNESKRWINKRSLDSSVVQSTLAPVQEDIIDNLIRFNPSSKRKKNIRRDKKSRYVDYLANTQGRSTLPSSSVAPSASPTSPDNIHGEPSIAAATESTMSLATGRPNTSQQVSLSFRSPITPVADTSGRNTIPALLSDGKTKESEAWSDKEADRTSSPADMNDWPLEDLCGSDRSVSLPESFEGLVLHWTTLGKNEIP